MVIKVATNLRDMSASPSGTAQAPGSLGRMQDAFARFFTKSAAVRESRLLEERFQLITLSGESLRGVRWTPGDKVQVALGGWAYRTYTPMSWDANTGSAQGAFSCVSGSPTST